MRKRFGNHWIASSAVVGFLMTESQNPQSEADARAQADEQEDLYARSVEWLGRTVGWTGRSAIGERCEGVADLRAMPCDRADALGEERGANRLQVVEGGRALR